MNTLGLKDQETYDCNCQAQDIKQGMCNLRVAVCFYFDSTASLQNADPTYRGYAFDLSTPAPSSEGLSGDGFKNATEAGQAAAANLFSLSPTTAKKCGVSSVNGALESGVFADHRVKMTL